MKNRSDFWRYLNTSDKWLAGIMNFVYIGICYLGKINSLRVQSTDPISVASTELADLRQKEKNNSGLGIWWSICSPNSEWYFFQSSIYIYYSLKLHIRYISIIMWEGVWSNYCRLPSLVFLRTNILMMQAWKFTGKWYNISSWDHT